MYIFEYKLIYTSSKKLSKYSKQETNRIIPVALKPDIILDGFKAISKALADILAKVDFNIVPLSQLGFSNIIAV